MVDNAKSKPLDLKWKTIYSYSETIKTKSLVGTPETILELKLLIRQAIRENLTICFRGPGNTFGEVVLNNNHMTIDTRKLERILSWNKDSGVMVVGAGATLRDVFETCFSDNWTLSAIPGCLDVTVVGAISNNVHGKDSVHHGNFGDQV
jgi:FAD/FMN-containing dehydrogenase